MVECSLYNSSIIGHMMSEEEVEGAYLHYNNLFLVFKADKLIFQVSGKQFCLLRLRQQIFWKL